MSRRNSSYRTNQLDPNENDPETLLNPPVFPPSRAPLNTIQNLPENSEKEPLDSFRAKFTDLPPSNKGLANFTTPKTVRGKAQSEPNSAHSTPTKTVHRVCSNGFAVGRAPQCSSVSRGGGSCSRVPRGICTATGLASAEVPHIDLVENSSFWMDHNVQVLIRIRPISSTERALQGYGRCLRQESPHTLTWLGNPEARFTFDHVACETVTQEMLFKVAGLPMVENCMSGYNSCMFAYGQTGSGKTYTMMGEIFEEMDNKLSEDRGMTPRIFEYLFMRIREEEEKWRDKELKYSCKCSFLEIYNEQITDLLEPSSTNLQLREDMQKGVYVENLTEYEVRNVKDVIELLFQGAANRKMAATNMNSESSRSHSVFTCVIESRWEKDAMTHLRFGRLNLVDLAGSERQKSSGAEGERLKEAANINKSLSTLGLVIMTLVDVAHGKHRHVPYRDSRLTFLLQDSLGGNSKTTIIANISPSNCCANETLSTLKFAQRAKLIQNNAKVNEDASGDVMALQRQIQQLKDQLTFFLKHQNALSCPTFSDHGNYGDSLEEYDPPQEINFSHALHGNASPLHKTKAFDNPRASNKKIKYLEATLTGTLRREKHAENEVQRLEAQIEHMNRLIHQREDDNQRTGMMLRFQEEKIRRLEMLANGLVSGDDYLMEENSALSEEIQLLRARIDRNPELTHFAMENIRLLEQVRMFQNFYEQGERETLLVEVSELRDQLLEALTEQSGQVKYPFGATENGAKVSAADVQHLEVYSTLEELENCKKKLVASLETNARLAREIDDLRNQLSEYVDCKEAVFHTVEDLSSMDAVTIAEADHYQPLKKTKETRTICQQLNPQVEADVVEKVLCIAEQHADIQPEADLGDAVELRDRLCLMNLENTRLAKSLTDRDEDIMAFTSFVEKLEKDTMDLTSLADGYDQPETTADLFPETRVWISGKLERAVKLLIQKDNIIADLQKALEGAQKMVLEMKMNIRSLRGATRAITEVQQQENNERCKEIIQLRMLLNEKSSTIDKLENKIKYRGDQIPEESLANNLAIKNTRIQESNQSQDNEFDDGELYAHFIESNSSCGQVKEICQSCTSGIYEHQLEGDHNEEKIKFAMLEMGWMLQTFEKRMEEAEAGCRKAREMLCLKLSDARLVAAEKSNQANTLLLKFEEAQETIEEADLVLNALLKANENAKHEADVWKQAGKELMAERAVLIEEVQQLKASASLMEKQCEFTDSISSLEESLVQIQTDLEETFKVVYHDIFSFGWELLEFIVTARSLLEDIWSDMIEKDFSLFVVHQCYLGFFHDKVTGSIPRSLEVAMDRTNLISENLLLKKELVRKDVLLKGLLFDFRLLQESASNAMDIKDETEEMMASLMQVQHELAIKTTLFDDISVQHRMLEAEISAKKAALLVSQSELEQAKGALELASKENIELKVLLDDIHSRNAITEKQLEEKYNVIEDLGKEILRLDSSVEQKILSSTEVIDNALRRVSNERDRLRAEVVYLKDQLEMAHALADENEAIAVEARQLSEASKIYAEQKEEEAKILERSVEELEFTINVLEKKVYEMGEEVDRQCLMREDLELELEALRPRMLTIQNATGSLDTSSSNVEEGDDPISREIGRHEFHEAKRRIQILERERSEQAEKIKQYEDYISELVLHAEAQTSQYHQKYTALEAMVREAKTESSSNSSTSIVNKTDKTRIRGSGSTFKCIAGLVQQMNSEKDQELSAARLRIEELEALAASRQKEVCMLSARLAAAESMTHDVIRDLLGVKLDMTNYANLIDQQQVQKLAEKAQQLSEESSGKELEILKLREQINDFIDERESLIREIHQRQTDTLAAQVAVEQLQQRDQLLAAQNEMLKMDKENLKRKVVGLDELVKKLSRSHNFQQRIHQHTKIKESSSSRSRNDDLMKRLAHSAKLLSRVNDVHSQFHRCDGGDPNLDSDEEQG